MLYRLLGRTGLKVSQLGFGAMRLPMESVGSERRVNHELAIPMIHKAFEAGVNYIDTAVGYCNGDSERTVGEALKGWRDKIVVSTKNPYYGPDEGEWWRLLEQSLERLQINTIDVYNHHGVNRQSFTEHVLPRLSKLMAKAKDQGLIKHICCSFHDTNEALVEIVESGYPEVITLQYNILDRQLEEGMALAHERGIGVVVMGPVGGGRLGVTSKVLESLVPGIQRVPELALRFVLSNPHVSVALSGMSTMQHVEENTAIAASRIALNENDRATIEEHLNRLKAIAESYCSGCGYCLPCSNEVAIPTILEAYNLGRVYGLWETAKVQYKQIGVVPWMKGNRADSCVECQECEPKCPQRLPISKHLAEAHKALT